MRRALVPVEQPRYLAALDRARRALAEATTVDDLKRVRDQVHALTMYAKQRNMYREAANECAEIKLRAERRIGELLTVTVRHQGGRPEKLSSDTTVLPAGISRDQSSMWQRLFSLPHDVFEQYIATTKTDPDGELTTAGAVTLAHRRANSAAVVSSESFEWYTPAEYVEAARRVMNGIDLDPASSEEANRTVKAARFYTRGDDGLSKRWAGRVWLNPPYSDASGFIWRLIESFESKDVREAVVLVSAHATSARWFRPLFNGVLCFTNHRLGFMKPGGDQGPGATFGSVFAYFGPRDESFAREFAQFGDVVRRWPAAIAEFPVPMEDGVAP